MDKKIKQFLKTIKLNESMLSLLFGVVTVLLVGILVFRVYNSNKPSISQNAEETSQPTVQKVGEIAVETKEDGKKYPTSLPDTYTVEKGDHLWKIAEKLYGSGYNWVDIAQENKLKNPGQLATGQELKLPKVAIKEIATSTSAPKSTPQIEATSPTTISGDSYKVVKGDNLWSIAVRAYSDGYKWTSIAQANNIAHPNYIEVGQELKLPR